MVEKSAFAPKAVLNEPDIMLARALLPIAVLNVPVVFESKADTPSAVVETWVPFHHLQSISPFIETLPFWSILTRSTLFVLNTRSCVLRDPRKSVEEIVFPDRLHSVILPGTVHQLARPVASEVRIFPRPGVPHVIFIVHATSSLAHGVVVPIPTFVPFPATYAAALLQSWRLPRAEFVIPLIPTVLATFTSHN